MAKSEKEIMGEIQAIIRQITASVTFLPMLEDKCTFDLLVYTKADSDVPQQWCVPLSPRCCPRTRNSGVAHLVPQRLAPTRRSASCR